MEIAQHKEFTIYKEDFDKLISMAQIFIDIHKAEDKDGVSIDTYETLAAKDLISMVESAQDAELNKIILEDNEVVFLSKLN